MKPIFILITFLYLAGIALCMELQKTSHRITDVEDRLTYCESLLDVIQESQERQQADYAIGETYD